jgi:hypothetical protein
MFAELIFWIIYIYKMLQNISFQLKKKKRRTLSGQLERNW